MINFDEIVGRLKQCKGFQETKEVADLFGISASDFSQRKKRGTLLPLITEWAINENINLDWLLTGRESRHKREDTGFAVHEDRRNFNKGYVSDSPINKTTLTQVITGIERGLEKANLELNPDKKAQLIVLLYDRFVETGKEVDSPTIQKYLRLVA